MTTDAAVLEAAAPATEDEVLEPTALLPDPASRMLPWQGIATYAADDSSTAMTSAAMLAHAGLDWEVGLRPLKRTLQDGTIVDSERSFETYRLDNWEQLGTVKSRYELLQNREAFDFGDSLIQNGVARWTHAGLQQGGSKLFMTMRLSDEFMVLGRNPMTVYLFLSSSHDGSRSCRAFVTPINAFCTNQTAIIRANNIGSFSIQHTSSMREKLADASAAIQRAGEYSELLKAEAERLAALRVGERKAKSLLSAVIPERRARREEIISAIIETAKTSATVADYAGTGWALVNGLTEYMDHGKRQNNDNARFESIMFGEGAQWRGKLVQALAGSN